MPTFDQFLGYAVLLEWFAVAAIVAGVKSAALWFIRTRKPAHPEAWSAVAVFAPLPLCVGAGYFLPVPDDLTDHIHPYLFWGTTWVGALLVRGRIRVVG